MKQGIFVSKWSARYVYVWEIAGGVRRPKGEQESTKCEMGTGGNPPTAILMPRGVSHFGSHNAYHRQVRSSNCPFLPSLSSFHSAKGPSETT